MGTTADKLNKLKTTKESIRIAINNKGGTLTTSDKFSDYSTAINRIQVSGDINPLQYIIDNQGGDGKPGCCDLFFKFLGSNLDNIINKIDTSKATDMSGMFSNCKNLTNIPQLDTSSCTNMLDMFLNCHNLKTIPQLNTSKVTNMQQIFYCCYKITTIPEIDTSEVTNMRSMFYQCSSLTTIPQLDTSKVTNMNCMFANCTNLTTVPQLDTSKVTDMGSTFSKCSILQTIPTLDLRSCTDRFSLQSTFDWCNQLTHITLLNIKASLDIGGTTWNGITWGHLIEKDCLIQIISELIDTGSSKTLTMDTANKAKIANTYVKLLEDDGTGKHPFEVCTSTDEGAMTIEAYCNGKNWTLA